MLGAFLLCHALALQNYALEFFKNREVLIGVVNLGIALALGDQKADLLHTLQLTLDVAGIFFYELG